MTSDPRSSHPTGARALVATLLARDVPLLTCVPGESFLAVLDGLYDLVRDPGEGPRLVVTRHEAAAANMAEAAGRLTGRPGVCLVTRGPGATHASIALHTAAQDGTPLLLVVGQVPRRQLGRAAFQEMDYTGVFGSSAKAVLTLDDPEQVGDVTAAALELATAGRPGPVVVVAPEDVLSASVERFAPTAVPHAERPVAAEEVAELLRALDGAQRPVMVVGGAGWSTRIADEVRRYAETNHVPLVAAFRWQDAVDNRSSAYAGYLGFGASARLRSRLEEADLVVGLGPRLDDPTTDGYRLVRPVEGRRLMTLAQHEGVLPDDVPVDLSVVSDLESAVETLAGHQVPASDARESWTATLRDEQLTFAQPPVAGEPDLGRIVAHVRSALPDDAVVSTGAGNYTTWVQRYFEFRQFGTQLAPRNGAMGYGVPAALAAAALHPGRRVVAFSGDGCFLMSGSELATAVQHDLRVVFVVVNNGMYGTIRMHQERTYPGRPVATALRNPDFASYARAFGMWAAVATSTEQFETAFATALAEPGPALIEIRTDPQQITPDLRLETGP